MIDRSKIVEWLKPMAAATNATLVREEQDAQMPLTYPILSYKIINTNSDSGHKAVIGQEVGTPDGDGDRVKRTVSWGDRATVSITFRANNDLPTVYNAANAAFLWIRSQAAKLKAEELGLVVKNISPSVEDRTVSLADLSYDNQMGFDLRIDARAKLEEQIEQVSTITISGQQGDDPAEDITVEEPV